MSSFSKSNHLSQGFSLVELMVVLSIVSVISGLAYPKYLTMKIRAGRIEAAQNLNHIHTLQEVYQSENETYGLLQSLGSQTIVGIERGNCDSRASGFINSIGFHPPDPCNLRYSYSSVPSLDRYNNTRNCNGNCFSARAVAVVRSSGIRVNTGKGFGIPPTSCDTGAFIGYSEERVINQDREFGYSGQGAGTVDDSNAIEQCK